MSESAGERKVQLNVRMPERIVEHMRRLARANQRSLNVQTERALEQWLRGQGHQERTESAAD